MRFNAPPGWPAPPPGWTPPPGWRPDPSWPPAPPGWQFIDYGSASHGRRPGFRGWASSMLPPAPPIGRQWRQLSISTRRAWGEGLGVYGLFFAAAVAAAVLYQIDPSINDGSPNAAQLALSGFASLTKAGLAIVMVLALSKLRGIGPGALGIAPPWASRPAYRWQAVGVGIAIFAAIIASVVLMGIASPGAHYPLLPPTRWNLALDLPSSINAGIVEELVVVAFLVTVLEQAGVRPTVIVITGVVLRLAYHVYYGPGVMTLAVWALVALLLYRRTRRITPLIIAHIVYDSFSSFMRQVSQPPAGLGLLIGLVVLATVIFVIVRVVMVAAKPSARRSERAIPVPSAVP